MEQLLSPDFDLGQLGLNFESDGFGPSGSNFDFKDQFDGKLFKPYNKKDKLGKLCDFAAAQTSTFVPPRQTLMQQQKQAAAVAESDLVTTVADAGFSVVEEKKGRENEKGDYRRRDKNIQGTNVHTGKLSAQRDEDKSTMGNKMQGPQMTRKR